MQAIKLSLLAQKLTILEDQISKEATKLSFAFTLDEREIHRANLAKLREDKLKTEHKIAMINMAINMGLTKY